jgi:hypothetical protein
VPEPTISYPHPLPSLLYPTSFAFLIEKFALSFSYLQPGPYPGTHGNFDNIDQKEEIFHDIRESTYAFQRLILVGF